MPINLDNAQQDPVGTLAAGLDELIVNAAKYNFMIVDDGEKDSLRYVQFLAQPDGGIYGEVCVKVVPAGATEVLSGRGWQASDPNWMQTWPAGSNPREIAQLAVETLQTLYGIAYTFRIEITIE